MQYSIRENRRRIRIKVPLLFHHYVSLFHLLSVLLLHLQRKKFVIPFLPLILPILSIPHQPLILLVHRYISLPIIFFFDLSFPFPFSDSWSVYFTWIWRTSISSKGISFLIYLFWSLISHVHSIVIIINFYRLRDFVPIISTKSSELSTTNRIEPRNETIDIDWMRKVNTEWEKEWMEQGTGRIKWL